MGYPILWCSRNGSNQPALRSSFRFRPTIGGSIQRCEGQMSLKIGKVLWKTLDVVYFLRYRGNDKQLKSAEKGRIGSN